MSRESSSNKSKQRSCSGCSNAIVGSLENIFFKLGYAIGRHPYLTILFSLLFAGTCCIGILEFTQESRSAKLWPPPDSEVLKDLKWVDNNFPSKAWRSVLMFEGGNVLTTHSLQTILAAHLKVLHIFNGTAKGWESICFRQGHLCKMGGILELWSFNETIIRNLTTAQILSKVNEPNLKSPLTTIPIDINLIVGGSTQMNNSIVAAEAAVSSYFIKNQEVFDSSSGSKVDKDGEDWEKQFEIEAGKPWSGFTVTFFTRTTFDKERGDAVSGGVSLLSIGYILIIIYLSVMLGKLTRLHLKVWLAFLGVLCVGLAIGVSFGLSSALGFFYGPVHSGIAFLILGIGVDDIFVIVQSWQNVLMKQENHDLDIPMKIALTMKHAGVAVSVTSLTDTAVFLIGATTILPGLRSFCIFAGLAVFGMFIFSCTTFLAFLTLDARRLESRRDACCCCCIKVSANYKPSECSDRDKLQLFFENVYAKYLLKFPVKIAVFVITIGFFATGFYGLLLLKQDFDVTWFLPSSSKSANYYAADKKYFPDEGIVTAAYLGKIDYFNEGANLRNLYLTMSAHSSIVPSTTRSWHDQYLKWIVATKLNSSALDAGGYPKNNTVFVNYLREYLRSDGFGFSKDVQFRNSTVGGLEITASRITASHYDYDSAAFEIEAMDGLMAAVSAVPFNDTRAFAYSNIYVGWNTNKVISTELLRNILLATLCVFLTTFILLANLWAALMVLTCVVFTLVNVAGFMHFWGLTVDTVSTIILILSVGLCVDYTVHIAHAFLAARGKDRNVRVAKALTEIGPAVLNGGISTFLAFCALGASDAYVFKVFFKVLLLIVAFSLFHGLVYLPCLLSIIGPGSYSTPVAVKPKAQKPGIENGAVEMENGVSTNGKFKQTNGSKGNPSFQYSVDDLANMKSY